MRKSIDHYSKLVMEDSPWSLNHHLYRCELGRLYSAMYKLTGDPDELDTCLKHCKDATILCPDDPIQKMHCQGILASALLYRYDLRRDLKDINDSIAGLSEIIDSAVAKDHPQRLNHLNNLVALLNTRFQHLGRFEDLEKAIGFGREAVQSAADDDVDKPMYLNSLGNTLTYRFLHKGGLETIDEAIEAHQSSVDLAQLASDVTSIPIRLYNLGNSVAARFHHTGTFEDLERALNAQDIAVSCTMAGHPGRPTYLDGLSKRLAERFEYKGGIEDIDYAISCQQEAIHLTKEDHANKWRRHLSLGTLLVVRFRRLKNANARDLSQGIVNFQEALRLCPEDHTSRSTCLNNIALSFTLQYEKDKNMEDLKQAISCQRSVLDSMPGDHPRKHRALSNLASSYLTRYDHDEVIDDLNTAISLYQEAVEHTLDRHSDSAQILFSLSTALMIRFNRVGGMEDIMEAAQLATSAVKSSPLHHAHRPHYLNNLGEVQLRLYQLLHDPFYLDCALSTFRESANSVDGWIPLLSALRWAECASRREIDTSLDAFARVMELVPRLAWLGNDISLRYKDISKFVPAVNEAVACAIRNHQYELAVEWFEEGKSIVWSQILRLRSPVDSLRDVAPDLADQLEAVLHLLEKAGFRNMARPSGSEDDDTSSEAQAQRHRRLAELYEDLIGKVRALPEFEGFLKATPFSVLRYAARNGPVVMINVSGSQCDALALHNVEHPPFHIPLPDLTADEVSRLQSMMMKTLEAHNLRFRDEDNRAITPYRPSFSNPMKRILEMLWKTVVGPITLALYENVSEYTS